MLILLYSYLSKSLNTLCSFYYFTQRCTVQDFKNSLSNITSDPLSVCGGVALCLNFLISCVQVVYGCISPHCPGEGGALYKGSEQVPHCMQRPSKWHSARQTKEQRGKTGVFKNSNWQSCTVYLQVKGLLPPLGTFEYFGSHIKWVLWSLQKQETMRSTHRNKKLGAEFQIKFKIQKDERNSTPSLSNFILSHRRFGSGPSSVCSGKQYEFVLFVLKLSDKLNQNDLIRTGNLHRHYIIILSPQNSYVFFFIIIIKRQSLWSLSPFLVVVLLLVLFEPVWLRGSLLNVV